jgi:7-keto-8-aminopelargonate synthetase-like enzyme
LGRQSTNKRSDEIVRRKLGRLDGLGLRRSLKLVSGRPGAHCVLDGREVVNFSSNDYLGLAGDTEVGKALAAACKKLGGGAGASRLVGGHHEAHAAVEKDFADWMRKPRSVFLPSGYHANIAALTALCGPGDVVFSDDLNHASIVDGCRLSGARVVVYRHADAASLARAIASPFHQVGHSPARTRPGCAEAQAGGNRQSVMPHQQPSGGAAGEQGGRGGQLLAGLRLVVTESIFSVNGDEAALEEIAALRKEHGFLLMVDEAHAIGCYGPEGRGICAEKGIEDDVDLLVGTFGKAVGATGAAIACEESIAELVISRGRSFMFTSATPPAVAAMVLEAIRRGRAAEDRRERLRKNTALFRDSALKHGIRIPGARAICPVVLGDERRTMDAMNRLWDRGFYVQALRPPTVPRGQSRLRVSVSAGHDRNDLRALAGALAKVTRDRNTKN